MAIEIFQFLDEFTRKYNRFFDERFLSSERWIFTKTKTAFEDVKLGEMKLSTGVMAESTIKARYDYNIFNIVYGTAYLRFQFTSIKDVFAFIGFKEGVSDPTFEMTENHAGIFINNGKIYFSTGRTRGNITEQKKVELSGVDPLRDFIYKIEHYKLSTCPLPQIIPYMDTFRVITPDRIWTLNASNAEVMPEDTAYNFIIYLKNLVNMEKILKVKFFTYIEEYAD